MPFELKNVSAMYQRPMNKMFACQIGWNMQVYMDDMLVKIILEDEQPRSYRTDGTMGNRVERIRRTISLTYGH